LCIPVVHSIIFPVIAAVRSQKLSRFPATP
jgi:hypothetical protein